MCGVPAPARENSKWVRDVLGMHDLIKDVVHQAIETGFLSVEAENHLRQMLQGQYSREDLHAFMNLQHAVMKGEVQQESWLRQCQSKTPSKVYS